MYKGKLELSHLGTKQIRISETEEKLCTFYSIKPLKKKKKNLTHHILLVDVSISMSDEILTLKEKLKETLQAFLLQGNNYVSVIIYSGHNESYRILNGVKCDKTSYEIAQVYSIIERELYTRSVTVMSEPLSQGIEIVEALCSVCEKHNIVLFTDGCLVPYLWSQSDERDKCLSLSSICKDKNIFLNTLGFGSYYDRDFLNTLTNEAGTGSFSHINEITDYSSKILGFADNASKTEFCSLEIVGTDYFVLGQNKRLKGQSLINCLKVNENNLIISFDGEISITEENIKYSTKKFNKSYLDDFLYSISLYHVNNEDIDSAEITIAQTGNLFAYSEVCNCYSFIEKGRSINTLTTLINNKEERKKYPTVKINITPIENEPLCFLEVIEKIFTDPKSSLLWNKEYKYKRIGIKSKSNDENLKFIPSSDEYGKIVNLSIGSSKLNIGVKVEFDGCVQNTKSKLKLDCKIFKDYNIFLNGNINTQFIWCILSKKLRDEFKKEGFILKNKKWRGKMVSFLDLTKLKATNKRIFKRYSSDEVSSFLYDVEVLSCKQWALNTVIKETQSKYSLSKLDTEEICNEEKEARLCFKVDNNGTFSSTKITNDTSTPYEIYPANYLEWRVDKFPKKKFKDSFKDEFLNMLNEENILVSYSKLNTLLSEVRQELRNKEFKINLVRISSALCNKSLFMWNDEFEKEKKQTDKTLNTNMVVGGLTKICTKNYPDFTIRQDKYVVLTKCN